MVINGEQTATCRVKVLCTTLDLPAKAKVLNFVQYNGQFGCSVCKEEGMMVKVCRGSTRVYKYSCPPTSLRNHEECYKLGRRALVQEEVCKKIQ